jgi:MFS transporter, DHA1 family, tetracycline resistance protein
MLTKKLLNLTIILTICLDFIGLGIVIPLLAPLFLSNPNFLTTFNQPQKTIILGLLISAYPLAQFLGAPFLGNLSDRWGRKIILIVSLIITSLSYLLFGIAILKGELLLMFLSRTLAGLGGANISTCLAALVDISSNKGKEKTFGLIGVASFSFGFIVGPFLGGSLSNPTIFYLFNAATPFFVVSLLGFLNLSLVFLFFRETIKYKSHQEKLSFLTPLKSLTLGFKLKRFREIFLVVFLITFGFNIFAQFFQVFLVKKFNFSTLQLANFFGLLGISLALTQGIILHLIPKRIKALNIIYLCLPTLSLLFPLLLLPKEASYLYFILPLIGLCQGLIWPYTGALVLELTDQSNQGKILGINQSVQSLAQGLPPLLAGLAAALNLNLPIIFSGGLFLLAFIIFIKFSQTYKKDLLNKNDKIQNLAESTL